MRGKILRAGGIAVLLCASFSCADRNHAPGGNFKNAAALNGTAAFLAGLDLPSGSALGSESSDPRYAAYRNHMNSAWKKYEERELRRIRAWRAEKIPGRRADTVVYPFSGPDILNAAAFFPDAKEYILMGLEQPGEVPDPASLPRAKMISELWGINTALRTLLMLNFFRTAEMQADVKSAAFTSITGIMMFFLARSGYEILEVSRIAPGRGGALRTLQAVPAGGGVHGVEIVFRKNTGAPLQRVRYFMVDLSDGSLKNQADFLSYLEAHPRVTTFIKSASYLLGYGYFSTLRNFILARTAFMVQDDTGVPLRDFKPEEWKLSFYGRYRVLEMFKSKFQADLAKAMKERNSGLLPFAYGYGFAPDRSHLMLAERKSKD